MSNPSVPVEPGARAPHPLTRILAAVAGDEGDERVLTAAAALARATGAGLWVVRAEEPSVGERLLASGIEPPGPRSGGDGTEAGALRGLPDGLPVTWETARGPAHRAIAAVAARISADLILVGSSADGGMLLGSTAERVVRRARVPVLVVRGRFATPRRVLAPVDLSELSASGFHHGLSLAARFAGGEEIEALALFAVSFLDPMSREMRERRWTPEHMRAEAERRLTALVAANLPGDRVRAEARVVMGPARESILDAAREAGVDLVVMSTHGYGGFERLLIGSVAATVVREASCSVLLVPPPAAGDDDADDDAAGARAVP